MNYFLRCISTVWCVCCGYGVALLIDVTHLCSPLCISVSFTAWCWCSFAVYKRQLWFIVKGQSNFNKSLKNGLAVVRAFGSHVDFLHFSSFFSYLLSHKCSELTISFSSSVTRLGYLNVPPQRGEVIRSDNASISKISDGTVRLAGRLWNNEHLLSVIHRFIWILFYFCLTSATWKLSVPHQILDNLEVFYLRVKY